MSDSTASDIGEGPRQPKADRLPVWRVGMTGGLVGILCCVGSVVLALLGIVSAATAYAWATNLYDNYAWWFRLGGLAVLTVAVGTYLALYAVTTGLGRLAWQGMLAGPDLTGGDAAVAESVLLAALGAVLGWWLARRQRRKKSA